MSYLARRLLMVTTPPFVGVLDKLATMAVGAWSLRRLRGGYAGPCLNIRRDSDNATQDIGFIPSGDLNIAALLAFVGSANGFVTAWYDQSGHGAALVQGNAASQPQIVAAGQVILYPSWPGHSAVETNGGVSGSNGQTLVTGTVNAPVPSLTFAQPFSRSSVFALPGGLSPQYGNPVLMSSHSDNPTELYTTGTSQFDMYAYNPTGGGNGFTAVTGLGPGSIGALLEIFNQASSSSTWNGTTRTGTVGTNGSDSLQIGGLANIRNIEASYGEIIVFPQPLPTGDQQSLATNQCQYWQTPNPYRGVVLADDPYAYWPLNETSGTVAADISGNSRNGTYQAGAQLAKGLLLPGMAGGYVGLTGASNSYVDVSAANQFCAGSAWSIECWALVASYNNLPVGGFTSDRGCRFLGNVLYTTSGGWQAGMEWGIQSSNGVNPGTFKYYDGTNAYTPFYTPPQAGVLQHVVLVRSGNAFTIYVNGKVFVPGTSAPASPTIQSTLQIGSPGGQFGGMNGTIGEAAVYNVALSAQQVATHYAAAIASRIGMLDGLTTPVVGAWSLRRLRGGYNGACLNVRRDSDNAASDIGFTAAGDLDIASLLAFVGTANGFVTTLYDQASNSSTSSNLAQSNTARQPQIVAGGVLNTASSGSSRPVMLASATTSSLQELLANASKLTLNQPFSRASVTGIPPGATSSSFGVLTGSTNASVIALNAVNLRYQMYDYTVGLTSSNAVTAGAINSVTENYNTTASSIVVNGTTTNGSIGSGGDGINLVFAGVLSEIAGASATLCEVIHFGTLLAQTDQGALYASQKSYWGTP